LIDTATQGNIVYYKPTMALILLTLNILSVVFYVVDIFKNKDKLSKEFKFMNIVAIVSICTINIFHMIYAGLTFYPLTYALIAYTIYFCIENPDIIMMNEIQRMQKENNEELNQSDNFLVNVDENILGLVNQISILSDENLKNISNREDINKRLNEIKKQGTILIEKMTEILDVSQYQTETRKIEDRKYETKELIKRVILYAQDKIKDKKLKLIFNINPNISSKLYGDIEKINQVIENVINYSTQNTILGRITISISSNKIENFEQITIKIVDTGEGINSEDMRNLFNENKTKFKSLFLSKKTIDLLGFRRCSSQIAQIGQGRTRSH
jgi:signal transduction histidine kinase